VQRAKLNYGGCDVVVQPDGFVFVDGIPIGGIVVMNGGSLISIGVELLPIPSDDEREFRRRAFLSRARSSTSLFKFPG
jgi:hypothetical protein